MGLCASGAAGAREPDPEGGHDEHVQEGGCALLYIESISLFFRSLRTERSTSQQISVSKQNGGPRHFSEHFRYFGRTSPLHLLHVGKPR